MKKQRTDTPDVLRLDCEKEVDRIVSCIRDYTARELKRRGLVVAVSGGIDSSVVAALCVQAVGKKHVFGLLMPEKESSSETQRLGELVVKHLDVDMQCTDITGILEAVGCYTARDKAIRSAIPEYERSFKSKIVLPNLLDDNKYRLFSVVAQSPDGRMYKARLSLQAYLNIVAATNFKQRVRKMLEYYHADRLNYAVTGTPNRLEYDQGFFVKLGDGSADIKPIAHLYKTQVYQLAEYLGLPKEIIERPPTTDTYSMPQSQEEFFFSVPYHVLDYCLYGRDHDLPTEQVAEVLGYTPEQIDRVYHDIDNKRRTTHYQHAAPLLVEEMAVDIQSFGSRLSA
jgi:NAD+ synthase